MEAATRVWEAQPRKVGPDLFAISGVTIPEYLTRPAKIDFSIDDDDRFEKVDHRFATVHDLYQDATIKLRKSAQAAAIAEKEMQAADEALKRAGGDMSAFLRDLKDAA
jgi:hypothetical protein